MELHWEKLHLVMRYTWRISRDAASTKQNVLVRLRYQGTEGIGEAAPNIRYEEDADSVIAFLQKAEPLLRKADPWHYQDLLDEMYALDPGQNAAKAGLDLAIFDLLGKLLRQPLHRLLGLNPEKAPHINYSIGIDTPEKIQKKIREAPHFPCYKIKVGTENDETIIQAVRSVTDRPLRVDANEGWTDRETALRRIEWLARQDVEFMEQPLPAGRLEDVAWLRERSPLPLIADEDVKRAADIPRLAGVYDGVNIKIMKSGGLLEALRMVHVARAHGLKVMLGCMLETSIAITAAAQISPLVDYADLDGNLLLAEDPYQGVEVAQGRLLLPDRPGLGIMPRAEVTAASS